MKSKSLFPSNFEKEYELFLKQTEIEPPKSLSVRIKDTIHKKLNPSKAIVFGSLLLTHIIISIGVLLACPHFGVTLIPGFSGLTPFFMRIGHLFCMILCGFLVLSPSLFYSALFFKSEKLKTFGKYRFYFIPLLTLLSLSCLLLSGGEPIVIKDVFAWGLGALFGGFLAFELGLKLNKNFMWIEK